MREEDSHSNAIGFQKEVCFRPFAGVQKGATPSFQDRTGEQADAGEQRPVSRGFVVWFQDSTWPLCPTPAPDARRLPRQGPPLRREVLSSGRTDSLLSRNGDIKSPLDLHPAVILRRVQAPLSVATRR